MTFKNIKQKIKTAKPAKDSIGSEGMAIINNLKTTKQELKTLSHNMEYVTNPILLNQLIYQLKAAEVRYQYWYCMARELNITGRPELI